MTEPAANAATTQQSAPNETASTELGGTVEERASALFPPIFDDGEDGSEPATDADGTATAPAPVVDKTTDQLAAERKARRDQQLADLKAKTRAGVDSKTATRRAQELEQQLLQERQARAGFVDPRQLSPMQILELGQAAGHTPKAIAEALKQAAENPEYVATHAARKVVDPELADLRQRNSALEARMNEFLQSQHTSQVAAAEDAAHTQIADFATTNAATAPYSASFLKAVGPARFRKAVEAVIDSDRVVGEGPQAVLDAVEDFLIEEHNAVREGMTAWNPTALAAPQRTQANQPRSIGTATQAPTHVTNSLAQARSSVVNEEAMLEDMPYEERSSFIFKRR